MRGSSGTWLGSGPDLGPEVHGGARADNPGSAVLVAAIVLAAVALPLVVLAAVDPRPHSVDVRKLNAVLAAFCAAVAVAAGSTGVLRWRLVGDPASVRVGVALGVLGMSFVSTDVVAFLVPGIDRHDAAGVLGIALTLTARSLLVFAVLVGSLPTRMTLRTRLLGALAVVAVFCVLVPLVPALDSFRRTSAGALSGTSDWLARAALIALWAGLAVTAFVRWRRHGTRLFAWIGLMSAVLVVGAIVGACSRSTGDLWITTATVCTTGAALVAFYGMSQELKHAYVSQRARLFQADVTAEERAARLRAEAAERAERSHQARSAVLALQGATRLLHENYAGREDPMDRALRDAIETEVDLLRRLVDGQPSGQPHEFDLAARRAERCRRAAVPWAAGDVLARAWTAGDRPFLGNRRGRAVFARQHALPRTRVAGRDPRVRWLLSSRRSHRGPRTGHRPAVVRGCLRALGQLGRSRR